MHLIENQHRIRYGQYYTNQNISGLVVSALQRSNPRVILELGAGLGGLVAAAQAKWTNAKLITVDIDKQNNRLLASRFPGHVHLRDDVLSDVLVEKIKQHTNSIDTALCNPPYVRPSWRKSFAAIVEDAGFSGVVPVVSEIGADILFLSQNIRLLRSKGQLGIIVPDGIISGAMYKDFRRKLIQSHRVDGVIQLPSGAFMNTEARTHILLITKYAAPLPEVPLLNADLHGETSLPLRVPPDHLIERMDYQYHFYAGDRRRQRGTKLGDIAEVLRGRHSSIEIKSLRCNTFHTTSFKLLLGHEVKFPTDKNPDDTSAVVAKSGDILIARVGRQICEQIAIVRSGKAVVSDCIFIVRLPKESRSRVFAALRSKRGQASLMSLVRGTCAQSLTKLNLLNLKV